MNLHFLNYARKNIVILIAAILLSGILVASVTASAESVSFNTTRNCDDNAVVYCGAMSTSELIKKYNDTPSVAKIYDYFGITKSDITNIGKTAQSGSVKKDGEVVLNGKVVATDAITAGREDIAGSTKVTSDGVTFYKRKPSVSFLDNSLSAYIVMNNGKFQFAILASCGNPVIATPTPTPKPTPKPTPTPTPKPTPTPTPSPKPTPSPSPSPSPTPSPTPTPTTTTLPKTGPSDTIGVFLGSSAVGTGLYQIVIRKKLFKF